MGQRVDGRTQLIILLGAVPGVLVPLLAGPLELGQVWPGTLSVVPLRVAAASSSQQAQSGAGVPGSVTSPFVVAARETGATTVALQWAAVSGASTYMVSWGFVDLSAGTSRLAPPGPAGGANGRPAPPAHLLARNTPQRVAGPYSVTELMIAGLDAGNTYRFAVQALADNGGTIAESEPAHVTLPTVPPNRLAASATADAVALSWSAVPEAGTYAVLTAAGRGALAPDPARAALSETFVAIDNLPTGVYSFQIEARDGSGGYLTRSNLVQANVGAPALAGGAAKRELPAPRSAADARPSFALSTLRTGPQTVRLSWPRLRGAGAFAVYQAQGNTPLAFAFVTGNYSTTLTGLASGIDYRFQVRARNSDDVEYATSDVITFSLEQ